MKQCPGCRTTFADRDAACPVCRRTDAIPLPGTPVDITAPGSARTTTTRIAAVVGLASRPGTGRISRTGQPAEPRPSTARIPPLVPLAPAPAGSVTAGASSGTASVARPPTARIPPPVALAPTTDIVPRSRRFTPPPTRPVGSAPAAGSELGWWPSGMRWGGIAMLIVVLPDVLVATLIPNIWLLMVRSMFALFLGVLMVCEREGWVFMARLVIGFFCLTGVRDTIIAAANQDGYAVCFHVLHTLIAVHAVILLGMSYSNPRARVWVVSLLITSVLCLFSLIAPVMALRQEMAQAVGGFERVVYEQRDQELAAFLKDHDHEAQAWLADDAHDLRGATHARAQEIVTRLYAAGAASVRMGEIDEDEDRLAARSLIIELPAATARRTTLFDVLRTFHPKELGATIVDAQQTYETLAFPEMGE